MNTFLRISAGIVAMGLVVSLSSLESLAQGGGAQGRPFEALQEQLDALSALADEQARFLVPSGAVQFFYLLECPAGWSSVQEASGRYLVGASSSTTVGVTVGTALEDGEERAVGTHSHVLTDAGHAHGIDDRGHVHTTVPHSHASDPHQHGLPGRLLGNGFGAPIQGGIGLDTGGNLTFPQSVNIGFAPVVVNPAGSSISVRTAASGVSLQTAGSEAGTPAPYLELLVCIKE